jgi:lipoprotein NlpD
MKKKSNKLTPFIEKMRFKYRVSVLNENTLEESWHIRLSRASVFVYVSAFLLFTFVLLTLLILNTPIANYLPGYGDDGNRPKIIQQSMLVDSLVQKNAMNDDYLYLIKQIVLGKVKPDSIRSLDSATIKEKAKTFVTRSDREKEFTEKFEDEEKYNLASIDSKPAEDMYVFFRPTKGVISSSFDSNNGHYGIYLITSPNESVVSVLEGTVLFASFTFDDGYVIQVQHQNNYISIYKNNTKLLKKVGERVKGGESIAVTGSSNGKKAGAQFYFELWKQGKPINPEDVIIF